MTFRRARANKPAPIQYDDDAVDLRAGTFARCRHARESVAMEQWPG
jgi:hypothetical protein